MEDIAVIGISCKFPNAENMDEYWDLIANGRDAISKVPDDRWLPRQPEHENIHAGFLKCGVDEFDAKFFGISPREAEFIDPQQRMLLEMTWTALEDAGINPLELKGTRTGVFMGIWRKDYENLYRGLVGKDDLRDYMGNSYAASSARISYFLGLTGVNAATDTGCSSSMMSLHWACQSLNLGESSLAVAGGINLLVSPFKKADLEHIISADGRCKTFDEKADGFGRAEGCGILILKKYSAAIRDGDRVLALIKGTGVSQEGTSSSFGAPSKQSQVLAIERAFEHCKLDPLDVDYIEAHGTGTAKGDPIEISAIAEVYGKGRKDPLIIGSVKTNVGHTESAAGMAGIIKVILSMKHGIIPPHINLNKLNPRIDLDSIPCVIPDSQMVWKSVTGKPRVAGVSSFGISGTNVHILVQEANQVQKNKNLGVVRPAHLLTISAKSKEALDQMVNEYSAFLSSNAELEIGDFCFTANSGRAHFMHRTAVYNSTSEGIVEKLQKGYYASNYGNPEKTKIAFLFPGQGSQYGQMGKELYDTNPVFKDALDYVCGIFEKLAGQSLLPIIFSEPENPLLHQSLYSQLSIFCIEYSLIKLWESFGISPDLVIGHSVGEFAAAFAAGALSVEDVYKLLYSRTQLISNLPLGGMLVVKCSLNKFQTCLKDFLDNPDNGWVDVACVNSPNQIVLSARKDTIAKLENACRDCGLKTVILASHHAYHSRDMDQILPEYEAVAKALNYQSMKCQYISGMSGCLLDDSEINSQYWLDHCRKSVNFEQAIQAAIHENCNIFIEIGPQPVLLGLGMQCVSTDNIQWLPSIKKKENNWNTILECLSQIYVRGYDVDWKSFDGGYERNTISIPTYPFQRQKFWFNLKSKINGFINNGPLLHPLVGKRLQVSSPEKYYQNSFNLEKLQYLVDHKVAHTSILPTSAMLEMLMVAGQLTLENNGTSIEPLKSLVLEEFRISSPFVLEDTKECLSEIIVTPLDKKSFGGFSIKLSKGVAGDNGIINWEKCAMGKFYTSPVNIDKIEKLDLAVIKSSCLKKDSEEMYSSFGNRGLTYGNDFRSIKNIWESNSEILVQIEIPETIDDTSVLEYLGHPIFIDGIIQLFVYDMKELRLPVGVKKYTWISRPKGKTTYAYAKIMNEGWIQDAALYSENGEILALIEEISFIRTSSQSFLKSLHSKGVQLPKMYEEIWQNQYGIYSNRLNLPQIGNGNFYKGSMSSFMKSIDKQTQNNMPLEKSLGLLSFLYVVKAFVQLGWNPTVGKIVDHTQIGHDLGIQSRHNGLMFRYLEILAEENFLVLKSAKNIKLGSKWQVIKQLPLISNINSEIEVEKRKLTQNPEFYGDGVELLRICGEKLADSLQGKQNPLELLFPVDKNKVSAEMLYANTIQPKNGNLVIVKYLECLIESMKNNISNLKSSTLRILEIGAGTGGTTNFVLPFLDLASIKYSYMYTDISSVFLKNAKEKFELFSSNMEFEILNIENDPLLQGFVPEQFDIIIASNVLHATKDLKETSVNCRRLLAGGGSLVIYETLSADRAIDVFFGVLDGYYKFSDYKLRPFHTVINERAWCNLLEDSGFESTTCYASSQDKGVIIGKSNNDFFSNEKVWENPSKRIWIIISDGECLVKNLEKYLRNLNRNTYTLKTVNLSVKFPKLVKDLLGKQGIIIEGIIYLRNECVDKGQFTDGMNDILKLTQFILTQKFSLITKVVLVTQGTVLIEDQSPKLPTDGLYLGYFKVLKNENLDLKVICIDLDANEKDTLALSKQIVLEAFSNDGKMDAQVAIRNNDRLTVRLNGLVEGLPKIPLPNTNRFSICVPETRSPADLKYFAEQKRVLGTHEVEVTIKATSLNFKDVMIILKPNGLFSDINAIGLDFSGIISDLGSQVSSFKLGEPVFGLANGACGLSSHVVVSEQMIVAKPDGLTHMEAAALPVVFLTSMYALEKVAKLSSADTVLIHAATGGVGLSAIQICRKIGAQIVATAGSMRKRSYLRSLGIEHVFDSRSTSYGKEIKAAVGGVDVVLNSLTGHNFKETTLSVCNKNARFVEIGAANIWNHEDVQSLRPDVSYSTMDLLDVSPELLNDMLSIISDNLIKEIYTPLPVTQFNGREILNAFEHFQSTQHIGKIVITTPTAIEIGGNLAHKCMLFSEEGTYIITGGLGGIGMEVTKFMGDYGAKNIVLVNRSPPNESALKTIGSLKEKSINVLTFQFDVGSFSDCQNLLEAIKDPKLKLPPLKGIIHTATGFVEATIPNQDIDKFQTVYQGKVNGAWNLHHLTRNYNLEYFVLFSSATSVLSPAGLSGYSSANAYLDSLAEYRYSLGLPATSINWGAWSGVGLVADRTIGNEGIFGITPFSPAEGLSALKYILRRNLLRVAVGDIDAASYLAIFPQRKLYMENVCQLEIEIESKKENILIDSETFYRRISEIGLSNEQAHDFVKTQIANLVKHILRLRDGETVDENKNFVDMGMDSLMTIEMKNKLNIILGKKISLASLAEEDFLAMTPLKNAIMSNISKSADV